MTYENLDAANDEHERKLRFYEEQASDYILRPENVFRGFLVSILTCQNCHHTSSLHEDFLDLSLPLCVKKQESRFRRRANPKLFCSSKLKRKEYNVAVEDNSIEEVKSEEIKQNDSDKGKSEEQDEALQMLEKDIDGNFK